MLFVTMPVPPLSAAVSFRFAVTVAPEERTLSAAPGSLIVTDLSARAVSVSGSGATGKVLGLRLTRALKLPVSVADDV